MSRRSARKAPREANPIHVGNGHSKRSRGIALSLNRILLILFIVVFGGIGTYFIFTSHADTLTSTYAATATATCAHTHVAGGCYMRDGDATGPQQNVCRNKDDFTARTHDGDATYCFRPQELSTVTYSCQPGDTLQGKTCTHTKTAGEAQKSTPKVTCQAIAHGQTCTDGRITCASGYIATASQTCMSAAVDCQHIPGGTNCGGKITCGGSYVVSGNQCVTPKVAVSTAPPTSNGCVAIPNGTYCNGKTTCNSDSHLVGSTCEKTVTSSGSGSTTTTKPKTSATTTKPKASATKTTPSKTTDTSKSTTTESKSKPKTAKSSASSNRSSASVCTNGNWYTTGNGGGSNYFRCVSGKWKATQCPSGQVAVASTSNSGPCEAVRSHSSGATAASTHPKQAANICGNITHAKTCVRHEDGSVVVLTCVPNWKPDGEQCAPLAAGCPSSIAHATSCLRYEDGTVVVQACSPDSWKPDGERCAPRVSGRTASAASAGNKKTSTITSKICGEPGAPTGFGQCSDPTNHQCGAHGQWKYNGASGCGCQTNYTGTYCDKPIITPAFCKANDETYKNGKCTSNSGSKSTNSNVSVAKTVSCKGKAHATKCESVGGTVIIVTCAKGYVSAHDQAACGPAATGRSSASPSICEANGETYKNGKCVAASTGLVPCGNIAHATKCFKTYNYTQVVACSDGYVPTLASQFYVAGEKCVKPIVNKEVDCRTAGRDSYKYGVGVVWNNTNPVTCHVSQANGIDKVYQCVKVIAAGDDCLIVKD